MKPPFPGLRPYLESESDIFFGQDSALQALLERLNSQHIVTLLGLSGCGKSSLLNAGLLANLRPRVVDGGQLHRWLIAEMKPGDNPLDRLEAELQQLFPSLRVREELDADTSGLERLIARAGLDPRQRVLIVVDQFEELFRYRRVESSVEREDRAAYFVKLLLQTRRADASQIYVLFAMRSEFLGECAMFYGLAEQVNSGTFLLPKMTRDQLEETVVGPLDDLNIGIEQELVQMLLNESEDQDDGLPLLQHALRRTWEAWQRRSQPRTPLTVVDFKTFRRAPSLNDSLVKHHLNDHLDSIYDDLERAQQLVAERMFRLLSEHDSNGRAVRRPLPYSQLASEVGAEVEAVVEAFRDVNLGRTFLMPPFPQKLAGATIDISHECLLRRWHLLKSWVEAEVRDAKTFISIAEDADAAQRRQIETGGRKPLAGATLDTYQAWRTLAQPSSAWARRYEGALDPQLQRPLREFGAAMEYLDWSIRLRDEDEAREKANRLRIRKLKISVWAAVGGILVLLLVMYVNRLHAQLNAKTKNEKDLKQQIDQEVGKNDAARATAQNITEYARQQLNQLDAQNNPAAARGVLEGVIALSNPQAKPVGAGWLYLGIVDKTGRAWAPSLVFNKLTFEPPLSADSPILQQLKGRRVRMGDFNNLREYAQPHAEGEVIQVLPPNTVVTIDSVVTSASIRRVKGVKKLGQPVGNWLTAEEGQQLLGAVHTDTLRGKRDAAMLGLLLGCGLRRSEVANLETGKIQLREERWAVVDLVGKGGHVRTVPMPLWVKSAIDRWTSAANIGEGRLFRAIRKSGELWGNGVTQNVVWYVVKSCAKRAGIDKLAPHDLRRSCARMCHTAGGEIEQIQFLLGHASVQTAERYIGCKQKLGQAVNDRVEFHLNNN